MGANAQINKSINPGVRRKVCQLHSIRNSLLPHIDSSPRMEISQSLWPRNFDVFCQKSTEFSFPLLKAWIMPSSHLTKAPPTFDLQFRHQAEQPGIEREDIPSPSFKSACSFLLVKGFRCEGWILTFYSFILALFNKSSSIANNNFTDSFCLLYTKKIRILANAIISSSIVC